MNRFRAPTGENELQVLPVAAAGVAWIGTVRRIPEAKWRSTTRMFNFGAAHDADALFRGVMEELRPVLGDPRFELMMPAVPAQRVESVDPDTGDLLILFRVPFRNARPSGGGTGPGEPMPVLKQAAAAG